MKMFRVVAAFVLSLLCVPASAQWQTPNHSVPIGRGAGVTGFGSAAPGTSGRPLVSNGASADPSFSTIGNAGFTVGPADTAKGTLDGVSTTDLPLPNCTAVNSAWRYTSGVGINCGAISVQTGYDMPINLGLSASAAGNALTLSVTQAGGSAPSSSAPVLVPFRSLTATAGTVTWRTITGLLSITIPNGATLGTSDNVPFRVWIFLDDNGGTPAVGVATCSTTTTIYPCTSWENTLKTSVAIDTSSDSAGVLYATAGVAADAVRIVGFCEFSSGLGTAGAWASSCTGLQTFGPGVSKPGAVVQSTATSTTTAGTTSSATFAQLTSTQTLAITPTSKINLIRAFAQGSMGISASSNGFIQMQRGTTLIGNPIELSVNTTTIAPAAITILDAPAATSAQTYSFQGKTSAGTVSYPASSTGAYLELQEIMG